MSEMNPTPTSNTPPAATPQGTPPAAPADTPQPGAPQEEPISPDDAGKGVFDELQEEGDKDGSEGDQGKPEGNEYLGAPESYNIDLPDGWTPDDAMLDQVAEIANRVGLSQKGMDTLVKAYVENQERVREAAEKRAAEIADRWYHEARKDPEIGGERWDHSRQIANELVRKYGDRELWSFLKAGRLGNHPGMLRFLARLGARVSEDTKSPGASPANRPMSDEERLRVMYPSMYKDEG
jgi:hypothetical protein